MSTQVSQAQTAFATVTLHLTQILVSYEDAVRLLRIRDTYDWHQRVWQAFGAREDEARDFLIRVDRKEEAYRVIILSRSVPRKPDWCPTACFGTKTIPDDYFQYARYRFSLLANPTKKLRVDNADGTRKKNGRRTPILKREELLTWLQRKATSGGFSVELDSLRTLPRGREFFHKPDAHGTHNAIEFQGELVVLDAAQFRATVATGVGSAKAFGFGLLTIAPVF
jgi:CRISPR system Cascade subunit CasE